MMTNDILCAICSGTTIGLSPKANVLLSRHWDWQNYSIMKSLGWEKADVQVRFCMSCFHSTIFPKFDESPLYNEKGSQVMRKVFESYFPDRKFRAKDGKLCLKRDFFKSSRDFLRFHKVTSFIAKSLQTTFADIETIRILDWGGGDGYIGAAYSNILSMVTDIQIVSYVYDYMEWKDFKTNRIGINDLKEMPKFHIVILSHILEHTHDPVKTVSQAVSFLDENGLVICEVPDERHNIIRAILRNKFGLYYHVCWFSDRSLHKVLERADLINIFTDYQYNSSYRGKKMSCILGIGQVGTKTYKTKSVSIAGEIISLISFTARKVLTKLIEVIIPQ